MIRATGRVMIRTLEWIGKHKRVPNVRISRFVINRTFYVQQPSFTETTTSGDRNDSNNNKKNKDDDNGGDNDNDDDGRTIGKIIEKWSDKFENEGIAEPVESIEHIVAHVIGTRKIMDLISMRKERLSDAQFQKLLSLCQCRLSRMPVQYIIGEWDFRDITLKMVPPVFIPRPETEILVDFVLKRISTSTNTFHKVLEIGCGSGAISLALAHSCEKIEAVAIDCSIHACNLAKENQTILGIGDRVSILNATLEDPGNIVLAEDEPNFDFEQEEQFDFIVSNPPYVPTKDIFHLAPEIKLYEDLRALDGGARGLKVITPILKYSSKVLKPTGSLFLEVDPKHPSYVEFYVNKYPEYKLKYEHTYKDFCNKDRFVQVSKL